MEGQRESRIKTTQTQRSEKPGAMLTVLGLLVYSVIQRQIRLSLRTHDQQLPGHKGLTAIPTAAVVLALFAQIALVQWWIDE